MMGGSMTVLVALLALCVVNMVLIWQVATLADEVHDFDDDMRATLMWFMHREARRMLEDGDGDGED